MSYRNITINDTVYQYVIGRSNIHIKGFGDFPTKVHGNRVASPGMHGPYIYKDTFVATPKTVRAIILGEETPVDVSPGNKLLMVDPFKSEIENKIRYLPYNEEAHDSLCQDI